MEFFKNASAGVLAIVLLVGIIIALSFGGLAYKTYFGPRFQNADRQIFEQTQSYVHGKIQDLAKYKAEYDKTNDPTERAAIKSVIVQQFAQFDSSSVVDTQLRQFLVQQRGF